MGELAAEDCHSVSMEDAPAPPEGFETISEGAASVLYRPGESFYNPAQVVNRDLSVMMLRIYDKLRRERTAALAPGARRRHIRERNGGMGEREGVDEESLGGMRILEALSATGLRSVRYAKEIPGVRSVIANDLDPSAVDTIKRNVDFCGCGDIVTPNTADAVMLMMEHSRKPEDRFDVIDLDPYGSAAPFLDSAVQAIADGGLLCITCTDLAVLCGNTPEVCFTRYGAQNLKKGARHEAAVRIVLHTIQTAAVRYGKAIKVMMCAQIDFYLRCFVTVHESKALCKDASANSAFYYCCELCESYQLQPLGQLVTSEGGHPKQTPATVKVIGPECPECSGALMLGGPIWIRPLSEPHTLTLALSALGGKDEATKGFAIGLAANARLQAICRGLQGELAVEGLRGVLHLNLTSMTQALSLPSVPLGVVFSALETAGFTVSQSHTDPSAIKSSASVSDLWDLLRCYALKHGVERRAAPGKKKKKKRDKLNSQNELREQQLEKLWSVPVKDPERWNFEKLTHHLCGRESRVNTGAKFPPNPTKHWGPKRAASGKRFEKESGAKKAKVEGG